MTELLGQAPGVSESQVLTPEQLRERNRLIAHLGRMFSRRYDISVLPSGQEGLWACALDPEAAGEMRRFIRGERPSLDDLPPNTFVPKQILYDEKGAARMDIGEVVSLLRHESGHAKYTDFRLMVEGQKAARETGFLPTSFWLVFEGLEDPRINNLEGEESPAIDRQIRKHQGDALGERLTETSIAQRPLMLQFTYNCIYHWLHGKSIEGLSSEVNAVFETARPLVDQYFQSTDLNERKVLQEKIWDVAKVLEKKETEEEEVRQMAQQQKRGQQTGQAGEGGAGQEMGPTSGQPSPQEKEGTVPSRGSRARRGFLERLKKTLGRQGEPQGEEGGQVKPEVAPEGQQTEKLDLTKLGEQELQDIKNAMDKLSTQERAKLAQKARQVIDEEQKRELANRLPKVFKLEKNPQTGEYEAIPQTVDKRVQAQAEKTFQQALKEVEAEEQAEREKDEQERRQREEALRQQERARRERQEMEKAGFNPETERDKFLLYQALEDGMYAHIRNFRQAIEKIIPRRKEPRYETGYFSGPRFDQRELTRKVPVGDEQFWQRPVEVPTGEPRLFVGLLVDNSGSMKGNKQDEARKTAVFFAKICREMQIPFMVAAFGDGAESIKQFRQDFDNPAERIKPKLIDATEATGGSTNMHAGLELTIQAMNEERRRISDSHGLIFVISDGGANTGLTGEALRRFVEENRGRLTFKAFGLSGNNAERARIQAHLNLYFGEGNCAYPKTFEELPDEAFRVLRANLIRFQRLIT